jgi:hypothetical protein
MEFCRSAEMEAGLEVVAGNVICSYVIELTFG